MPLVSKEIIGEWGKEAASNLINHNIPLNDSVTKIASDNHLNIDQIARTVEAANISMHTSVYKNNAYPEFDTASLPVVASRLSMPVQEKSAELTDYDTPPNHKMFPKTASAMYSTEIEKSPLQHYKEQRSLKEIALREEEKYAEYAQEFYDAVEDVKKTVLQMVLDPDTREGANTFFKVAMYLVTPEHLLPAAKALTDEVDSLLSAKVPQSILKVANLDEEFNKYASIEDLALDESHPLIDKIATYYMALEKCAMPRVKVNTTRGTRAAGTRVRTPKTPTTGKPTKPRRKPAGKGSSKQPPEQGTDNKWKPGLGVGLGIGGAATGAAGYVGYKSGQRDTINMFGPMSYNNLPSNYKR